MVVLKHFKPFYWELGADVRVSGSDPGGSHLWMETGYLSYYGLGHKILDYSVAVDVKRNNILHCPKMLRTCLCVYLKIVHLQGLQI